MVINIKHTVKHFGITIITMCAVLVTTMFTNLYLDMVSAADLFTTPEQIILKDAQIATAKMVCIICGAVLMMTSVVMLVFYIRQYVDSHKKELGILKALGHSNFKIAKSFWVFGINVFVGTGLGFAFAYAIMEKFYEVQNADGIFPAFGFTFHPILLIVLVLVPTAAFMLISVGFALLSLRRPVIGMLKEIYVGGSRNKKVKNRKNERAFKSELRSASRGSNKFLLFFILFAAFCFASNLQMAVSMRDYTSDMMSGMILVIGMTISVVMLYISVNAVINGNRRCVAMMRTVGYSDSECYSAVLGCYRPMAYMGFAVGTAYQYGLLRIMIDIVFADFEGLPPYELNIKSVAVSLALFVLFYELLMLYFSRKIKDISVKEIML
ncbi:MAG: ABC transporter permease [Oscillospiraceae bacterium]|nr:ABC transporter permease [Oscillospiraceae bacterium]